MKQQNWEKRLEKLAIIVHAGELKGCKVYHEAVNLLIKHLLEEQKEGFNKLIVKEIRIAQDEEKPTSRLTSLYNKLNKQI